jgi:hypothetical protein
VIWFLLVGALVLICVMGRAARRLQGGPSYNGVTVDHYDHDYDAIQRKRIAEGDPYRGGADEPGQTRDS